MPRSASRQPADHAGAADAGAAVHVDAPAGSAARRADAVEDLASSAQALLGQAVVGDGLAVGTRRRQAAAPGRSRISAGWVRSTKQSMPAASRLAQARARVASPCVPPDARRPAGAAAAPSSCCPAGAQRRTGRPLPAWALGRPAAGSRRRPPRGHRSASAAQCIGSLRSAARRGRRSRSGAGRPGAPARRCAAPQKMRLGAPGKLALPGGEHVLDRARAAGCPASRTACRG